MSTADTIKFSGFVPASSLTGSEGLAGIQGSGNVLVTPAQLAAYTATATLSLTNKTVSTPAAGDSSGALANTNFVTLAIAPLAPKANPAFTGVATFAARPQFNGATPYDSANLTIANYAPLASPALTGSPSVNGVSFHSSASSTGPTWPFFPRVWSDGGMEVGSFIDFHTGSADGIDYRARLSADSGGNLNINSGLNVGGQLQVGNSIQINVPNNGQYQLLFNRAQIGRYTYLYAQAASAVGLYDSVDGSIFSYAAGSTDFHIGKRLVVDGGYATVQAGGTSLARLTLNASGGSARSWSLNSNTDGTFYIGDESVGAVRAQILTDGSFSVARLRDSDSGMQFGGAATTGIYGDGNSVAVRGFGNGLIYFQAGNGAVTYATLNASGFAINYAVSAPSMAISGALTAASLNGFNIGSQNGSNLPALPCLPSVKADGVMEIGAIIDFHQSSSDGDYTNRLSSNGAGTMQINGVTIRTAGGNDGDLMRRNTDGWLTDQQGSQRFYFAGGGGYTYAKILSGQAFVWQNTSGSSVVTFDENGNASFNDFTVRSDRRLKVVEGPIADAGAIVDATRAYRGSKLGRAGFFLIADEAAAVTPELVRRGEATIKGDDTPLLELDLVGYMPIVLAELKALRARVAELEAARA